MKGLRYVSAGIIVLAVLALGLRFLVIKIEPGEIGVVNAEWTSGLIEEDFGPGFHWSVGPLHTWTVFDGTVQTLHMHRDRDRAARNDDADVERALEVKSSDGATITIDVTLKYRIKPGKAWRLLKTFGSSVGYKEKVRNTALDVLRISLGDLAAEEFYDPKNRAEVAAKMEGNLREQIDSLDVELVGILIRDLAFEERFEERIKRKTLASEEQQLNKAQTLAAEMAGKTNKIEAETGALVLVIDQERDKTLREMKAENDKTVAGITAEYRKSVQELQSDADLYAALKGAEATLLLKEAEAKGQAARRDAVGSPGGAVLVALELAKSLRLGDMSVSTQAVNPLDIDAMIERLGAVGK